MWSKCERVCVFVGVRSVCNKGVEECKGEHV